MNLETLNTMWVDAWPIIAGTISVASILDASLPQPAAGSHWLVPRKILSFIAVNLKNASNGAQPAFSTWLARIGEGPKT